MLVTLSWLNLSKQATNDVSIVYGFNRFHTSNIDLDIWFDYQVLESRDFEIELAKKMEF